VMLQGKSGPTQVKPSFTVELILVCVKKTFSA